MKILTPETKIGFFTLFSLLAIGYMFFVLNPRGFSGDSYKPYYTLVPDASGIIENSNVLTNGVVIGKVKSIELSDEGMTRIDFEVKSFVKIPEGSRTGIKGKGLLGDVFLEVVRSNRYDSLLSEGARLEAMNVKMSINDLTELAGSVGKDVKQVTSRVANAIGNDESEKALKDILMDLRDSLALVKTALQNNTKNIDKITESIRKASENVEQASVSIKSIAGGLDSGKGTLGKLLKDEKIAEEIEEGLVSVNEVLSPARRLRIDVDYHGEYRFFQENQHFVNVRLQTQPDLFYLLGVTNAYKTEQYSSLEIDGNTSGSDKDLDKPHESAKYTLHRKEALRFNVQIGKRWGDLELRLGLFESTGGIAADYYFFSDIVKLGFEAYEWNLKNTEAFKEREYAYFKTYLSVNFLSNLYLIAGLNDFTRLKVWNDGKYPIFVGAGFHFTDRDLTSIMSASSIAW